MEKKIGSIIAKVLLGVAILAGIWCLWKIISTPINFDEDYSVRSGAVISRIKDIRTAERQFKSKYQHFTADFDTLINFILTDSIEYESKIADENDSLAMVRAQAEWKKNKKNRGKKFQNVKKSYYNVKDSIFKHLTVDQVKDLKLIPFSNGQEFLLEAKMLETESKVVIPVVECRAPFKAFLNLDEYKQEVINLIDDYNSVDKYPGIKFGDMNRGNNEAGNWE